MQHSSISVSPDFKRFRRLRAKASVRSLVQEHWVHVEDLIQPLFIKAGSQAPEPIHSMPNLFRLSIDDLLRECESLQHLGIQAVAVFPFIHKALKDPMALEALNPKGLVVQAITTIKKHFPDLTTIVDIALDPYTNHSHDGVLTADGSDVDNDATITILAEMAVIMAQAGVDWVAPSDMMDGRVAAIRTSLNTSGFHSVAIHAYAAKYASAYYGPFRNAVGSDISVTQLKSKHTYQLNPANTREALKDALQDEIEGADILMVKPAGAYLDIIYQLRQLSHLPISAYQVSGEYAQILAAAQCGWLDLVKTRDESLLAIKRAGADMIFSYFAKAYAQDHKLKGR
jgi:porphobilinogen synthase